MSDTISGVKIIPLKLLPNEKGRLMEVQRVDDTHFPGFGQTYITSTHSGVVKAWYRHHHQIDQIASVTGLFKIVLYDTRNDSPTKDEINEIILGELAPKLVQIPPGIWHGFKNIGTKEAFLLHLNSIPFRFEAPDEDRLSSNDRTIPYNWENNDDLGLDR